MPHSTTSIKLDDDLRQRLQKLAEVRQRTPHWLMKQAIAEYVSREEDDEEVRAMLQSRWRNYQETGLHVTAEEANAWLEKLARGERLPLPKPHT